MPVASAPGFRFSAPAAPNDALCKAWTRVFMAPGFSQNLEPQAIVFDFMDELSAFNFAPPLLKSREEELLKHADVVFTGGNAWRQRARQLRGCRSRMRFKNDFRFWRNSPRGVRPLSHSCCHNRSAFEMFTRGANALAQRSVAERMCFKK